MSRRIVQLDKTFTMGDEGHHLQLKYSVFLSNENDINEYCQADLYVFHCQNSKGEEVTINESVIPEMVGKTWLDLSIEAIDLAEEIEFQEMDMYVDRQMELEERLDHSDMD